MELKWLEDLVTLADTRSFSRSAEMRHVTQPAFSRRIRALEDWLGAELIDRNSYPSTLTEAGREFLETAKNILSEAHDARHRFRASRAHSRSAVTFVTLHALALSFFPGWIKKLEGELGDLRTRVIPGNPHDIVSHHVNGNSDFLLCYSHPSMPVLLEAQQFPSLVIGEDQVLPVCVPGPDGKPLFDLEKPGTPYLAYTADSFLGRLVTYILNQRSQKLANLMNVHETPVAESLKAMALIGSGVAWLPESSIRSELAAKRLIPVGSDSDRLKINIRLYKSSTRQRTQVGQLWRAVGGT